MAVSALFISNLGTGSPVILKQLLRKFCVENARLLRTEFLSSDSNNNNDDIFSVFLSFDCHTSFMVIKY